MPIEEGILAKLVLDTSHHGAALLIIGGFRWEGVEGVVWFLVYLVLVLVVGVEIMFVCVGVGAVGGGVLASAAKSREMRWC